MTVARSARAVFFRGMDLVPWALGGTLLWLGLQGNPAVSVAGSLMLTVAGFLYFAGANGYTIPRLGLVRIAALGGGDEPLAFFVRHRGRGLLFHRDANGAGADPSEAYCVVAVPDDWGGATPAFGPWEPPEDSRLLGAVPVAELVFAHRGGAYVDRASLVAALRRLNTQTLQPSR